jgi:hypothetical protein
MGAGGWYVMCNVDCLHLGGGSSEVEIKQYGVLFFFFLPFCFTVVFACAKQIWILESFSLVSKPFRSIALRILKTAISLSQ